MITQHAWMFLSSYEKLRVKLLLKDIVNMVHLGAKAFEEIGVRWYKLPHLYFAISV